ncbi:hypothetical protein ERJ75_001814100 [Trypanosoma vivax]|nr:hypothetical protein ERJ75_001814100 [Trypanosoma vivax]
MRKRRWAARQKGAGSELQAEKGKESRSISTLGDTGPHKRQQEAACLEGRKEPGAEQGRRATGKKGGRGEKGSRGGTTVEEANGTSGKGRVAAEVGGPICRKQRSLTGALRRQEQADVGQELAARKQGRIGQRARAGGDTRKKTMPSVSHVSAKLFLTGQVAGLRASAETR